MKMKAVTKCCPMCYKNTTHKVDMERYFDMMQRGIVIQKAFPEYSSFKREFLINGMCYDCQEKFYNRPAPGHEKAWGKQIGVCDCCDAPVYEKDVEKGVFRCVKCYQTEYSEV